MRRGWRGGRSVLMVWRRVGDGGEHGGLLRRGAARVGVVGVERGLAVSERVARPSSAVVGHVGFEVMRGRSHWDGSAGTDGLLALVLELRVVVAGISWWGGEARVAGRGHASLIVRFCTWRRSVPHRVPSPSRSSIAPRAPSPIFLPPDRHPSRRARDQHRLPTSLFTLTGRSHLVVVRSRVATLRERRRGQVRRRVFVLVWRVRVAIFANRLLARAFALASGARVNRRESGGGLAGVGKGVSPHRIVKVRRAVLLSSALLRSSKPIPRARRRLIRSWTSLSLPAKGSSKLVPRRGSSGVPRRASIVRVPVQSSRRVQRRSASFTLDRGREEHRGLVV